MIAVLTPPQYNRWCEVALLSETSRYVASDGETFYRGYLLKVQRGGGLFTLYRCVARRRITPSSMTQHHLAMYGAGEQAAELARWSFMEDAQLHHGELSAAGDITPPLPDRLAYVPFDPLLELYFGDLMPGVYTLPGDPFARRRRA